MRYSYLYFILIGLSLLAEAAPVKRYVKPIATGTKNGFSWANAGNNLQQTINASATGDTIWVAAGTYTGGFNLKQGVQLYGGFAGNETSLSERKFPGTGENLTVLDGADVQRVLTQDSDFLSSTVVDGFVIQHGSSIAGAGAYLRSNSILRRCIVRNNIAGEIRVGDYMPAQGGVVFRMDKTTGLGYIIAGENHGQTYQSSKGTVKVQMSLDSALLDMNGLSNTKALTNSRSAKAVTEYIASAPGDVYTDWYIPSAGEWSLLVSGGPFMGGRSELCELIEQKLVANNKQPFGNDKYWSSTPATEGNYPEMWYANFGTMSLNSINALQYNRLRPMRAFLLNVGAGHGGGIYATSGARIEGCLVYGNTAAEGTGVYTIGNVPIHYSTVVANTQSSSGYTQSQGLVTSFTPGVSEISSVTNSIIWGNRDADNQPSNLYSSTSTRVLYTAWESAETVTGTGNIALPSDNLAENGIKFKNPDNFDFNILEASACALTGDKRRIPAALTSDLNGVLRSSTLAQSMGAFEFIQEENALDDLFADSEISVYPNPVRSGKMLSIINRSKYRELTISVINLVGQIISTERFTGNDLKLQMPYDAGTYFVKVTTNDGVSITKKITVQ